MKKLTIAVAFGMSLAAPALSTAQETGEDYQSQPITSYESADCEAAGPWKTSMEDAGFQVNTMQMDNLDGLKTDMGIPETSGSCHTAMAGDYILDGYVPPKVVEQLFASAPNIKGAMGPNSMDPIENGESYDIYQLELNGGQSILTTINP